MFYCSTKKEKIGQKNTNIGGSSIFDSSAQGESLQRKADMANNAAQRAEVPRPNNTGMPDNLKAGIESLSGFSMDDVRVHYNSPKPATVQALAYTQGTDIHVAPGQEKCLPHEAWHVAQQMAGRVSPTTNINGMPVNDNAALEHEADVMGAQAVQYCFDNRFCSDSVCRNVSLSPNVSFQTKRASLKGVVQGVFIKESFSEYLIRKAVVESITLGHLNDYWNEQEIDLMVEYFESYCSYKKVNEKMNEKVKQIKEELKKKNAPVDGDFKKNVDKFVENLNEGLKKLFDENPALKKSLNSRYIFGFQDGVRKVENPDWSTCESALAAVNGIPKSEFVPPQGHDMANIPVIPWSVAKCEFPTSLVRLMRDIYIEWYYGRVMDERTQDEQARKEKNCNTPGALRSWHANGNGSLPGLTMPETFDSQLHNHYDQTSQNPYDGEGGGPKGKSISRPVGYAEYTGTGMGDDRDNCKIVLDYVHGYMYLTLTHYSFWKVTGKKYEVLDKTGEGEKDTLKNPWFKIEMNS
nr:DUF4157 domain-containing protein [Fibrobacter sp. UWB2]